jgi:hypothetical protein
LPDLIEYQLSVFCKSLYDFFPGFFFCFLKLLQQKSSFLVQLLYPESYTVKPFPFEGKVLVQLFITVLYDILQRRITAFNHLPEGDEFVQGKRQGKYDPCQLLFPIFYPGGKDNLVILRKQRDYTHLL